MKVLKKEELGNIKGGGNALIILSGLGMFLCGFFIGFFENNECGGEKWQN